MSTVTLVSMSDSKWKITRRPQNDGTVNVTAVRGACVIHVTFKNASEAGKFGQAQAEQHHQIEHHEVEGRERQVTHENRHDYEPGSQQHKMHTDPLCAVCGSPKNATVHEESAYTTGYGLGQYRARDDSYDPRWDFADAAKRSHQYFKDFKRGFEQGFDDAFNERRYQ